MSVPPLDLVLVGWLAFAVCAAVAVVLPALLVLVLGAVYAALAGVLHLGRAVAHRVCPGRANH